MPQRTKRTQGTVIYSGPSQYNGDPIVVIMTGLIRPSSNSKTGAMAQVMILMRDIHPQEAIWARTEGGICGGCGLRPKRKKGLRTSQDRKCYVNITMQGIAAVWTAFTRGRYPVTTDLTALGRNRLIRAGTYGDPAAVPPEVWEQLLAEAKGWTGYTHGWRKAPRLKQWFQASVETEKDFFEAASQGWGTYRIKDKDAPYLASEIMCPASDEAGHSATCATCLKCNGSYHVAIQPHGALAVNFSRRLPILQEA